MKSEVVQTGHKVQANLDGGQLQRAEVHAQPELVTGVVNVDPDVPTCHNQEFHLVAQWLDCGPDNLEVTDSNRFTSLGRKVL